MITPNQKTFILALACFFAGALVVGALLYYHPLKQTQVLTPVSIPDTTSTTPPPPEQANSAMKITAPRANETVTAPFIVSGNAPGGWFFEASFPIRIVDQNNKLLATTVAHPLSSWMSSDPIAFEAAFDFIVATTTEATMVFNNDNPSGLPENDREFSMPITLIPNQNTQKAIRLFYYNQKLDTDEMGTIVCSQNSLVAVDRIIPSTNTPIQDALRLLLKGQLTDHEKAAGLTTEFPLEGFALTTAALQNEKLTATFTDPNNTTSGGACRTNILRSQIEVTARQFAGVTTVTIQPETLFQP